MTPAPAAIALVLTAATSSGNRTADDGTFPPPEVAMWISSNTPSLPVDLSAHSYLSLLMDARYSLTWSEGAVQVTDTAPTAMSTFVSAYPPDVSRERHLATYSCSSGPVSNQLLSDPLNLADAVAAHFASISSAHGGLDIDIENFGRTLLSAYAAFVRGLRSGVGAGVPISITVQISWSNDPHILALITDGTADAMNVMYYDHHAPWTEPGPVAPYEISHQRIGGCGRSGVFRLPVHVERGWGHSV